MVKISPISRYVSSGVLISKKNVGGGGKMAKFPRPFSLLLNIQKVCKRFTVQTQKIRPKLLESLKEIFDLAKQIAKRERRGKGVVHIG